MLLTAAGGGTRFTWRFRTQAIASSNPGVSIVPGASSAEGSWTGIALNTDIVNDVFGVRLRIQGGNVSATSKEHLLDLGWDPAGGTTYVEKISNLACGESATFQAAGSSPGGFREYYFPIYIPAGSAVAVRIQGLAATAGTVRVDAVFYGKPTNPDALLFGQYAETVGAITGSSGVTFSPGNATNGSWADLGTTVKPCWLWQLCVQNNTTTMAGVNLCCDLAFGDASNKHLIIEGLLVPESSSEAVASYASWPDGYGEVPAGSHLYVRGSASGAPAGTHNAVAIGIGG